MVRLQPDTTQAAEVFIYDAMGRVLDNSQCTPQNCTGSVFPVTYTYDYLGDPLTGTNGLGTTLTYSYNRAPRLTGITSSLSDANHPGTLLSGVHYNAFGGDTSATLGNNVVETLGYAQRGWLQSLSATLNSTSVYSFSLGFAGNGDVTSGNDSVNGNWNYGYDDFNRLCASNKGGQQNLTCLSSNNTGQQAFKYVYDRYGNRWQQNVTAGSGPAPQYSFDANNRISSGSGVTYDAAGNVTNDGSHSYTYDAENRIIKVDNGTTAVYVYDAAGNRVRKTTGSVSVDYLYDLAGHVITELSSSGGWNRGEVFAGGHHIATYTGGTSGTISFTHADWLGTERKRTDMNGASIETCTNLPFGDGQSCSGSGGDPSPLHFTGKQRDTETNDDDFGARYFNSGMARWLTPDWSARPEGVPYATLANPQTLNLYAYVGNNPVTHTDPDGHISTWAQRFGEAIQNIDIDLGLDVVDPTADSSANVAEAEASQTAQQSANNRPPAQSGVAVADPPAPPPATVTPPATAPPTAAPPEPVPPPVVGLLGAAGAVVASAYLAITRITDALVGNSNDQISRDAVFSQVARENDQKLGLLPEAQNAEHTAGERGSTKDKHQAGQARRKKDRGGEKGDARRMPPRKRPPGWKGPWPPRPGTP